MKTILHLCADTGSDTWPYRNDPNYEVITIGKDIGVENYSPNKAIHGIIANPVCTEFSRNKSGYGDLDKGMFLVNHCLRIIEEAQPVWYAIENPASGLLDRFLGRPQFTYEPWQFGSPWTKKTSLWGSFEKPDKLYYKFEDVQLNPKIYVRPGRKPSMAWLHKNAFFDIPEFADSGMPPPQSDMEMRSLCSQNFAKAFKKVNP